MPRIILWFLFPLFCLAQTATAQSSKPNDTTIQDIRTQLSDARDRIRDHYHPTSKVTRDFFERCAVADKAMGKAESIGEVYAILADALASLDSRIRFYPSSRVNRIDYSWEWQLIGKAAYVTQVDQIGNAAKQGLLRGDQILSIEGIPVERDNFQQVYYVLNTLAPRTVLRVQAQTPGQEPRWLAIESTVRPQRKMHGRSRIYSKEQHSRFEESLKAENQVQTVGKAAIWRPRGLNYDPSIITKALKLTRDAGSLVIDLRGVYLYDHKNALRLLDGLFKDGFEAGIIEKDGFDDKLTIKGGSPAFVGTVLVLVDSETAVYAELLTHIIQQRQRGVIIGDRTMGRVFEERMAATARGMAYSFSVSGVGIPMGEVVLKDGAVLDGKGVAPDYQILTSPIDLAGRRDVVMSKALALVKETISPEDAYKLFPHYEDVDDDY